MAAPTKKGEAAPQPPRCPNCGHKASDHGYAGCARGHTDSGLPAPRPCVCERDQTLGID